jgi:hypothetical protein
MVQLAFSLAKQNGELKMKPNRKLYLFLIVVFLALLACGPSDLGLPNQAPDDAGAVATSVAATMTAAAPGNPPGTQPPGLPTAPPGGTQPPPAPAVLRIAFNDGNNLKLWTEGVGVTNLYTGDRVDQLLLSDDGQVVAFVTLSMDWVFTGLWAAQTDGSSVQRLVDAPTMNAFKSDPGALEALPYYMEFIPGTHTLAFNTRLTYEGPGLAIQDDLRLLDMDTGLLSTFLDVGQAGMFYYSPDGSQIALSTPTSISLINADGTNRRDDVLTYPAISTYSEYQWYSFPRWWPDGSQLDVVIPSPDMLAPGATMTVWNIPTDGTPPFFLGTYTTNMAVFDSDRYISPDMSRVAYLQQVPPAENNIWDLHIAELNGASNVVFATGNLRFVSWSPESGWFVYTENQDYKVAQVGDGVWPLADHPTARGMQWIDEDNFIYLSGSSGSWDLRMGSFNFPSIQIGTSTADTPITFDFSN